MSSASSLEKFPSLDAIPCIEHAFTGRVRGLDVKADRELALQRLDSHHAEHRGGLGLAGRRFVIGQQVHGREVAIVDAQTHSPVPGVDGLITASDEICLGIYVADCSAVYLVDPVVRVIALLHSGRKGTELNITGNAIALMVSEFGCEPSDIVAQLSPCIRPPNYEVDFAALIVGQCRAAGIVEVHDCGICTAANLDRYYSYRAERGKTGRMLAMLALTEK